MTSGVYFGILKVVLLQFKVKDQLMVSQDHIDPLTIYIEIFEHFIHVLLTQIYKFIVYNLANILVNRKRSREGLKMTQNT